MADVFLSYSSADRELTRGLDAELVAAGYTVYWDDMLLAGERFQDALTAQINAAVAVVVIWTPHPSGPTGSTPRRAAASSRRRSSRSGPAT